MSLMDEKEAFSKRLTRLLDDAGIGIASPTEVAREFNRRIRANRLARKPCASG